MVALARRFAAFRSGIVCISLACKSCRVFNAWKLRVSDRDLSGLKPSDLRDGQQRKHLLQIIHQHSSRSKRSQDPSAYIAMLPNVQNQACKCSYCEEEPGEMGAASPDGGGRGAT